MNAHFASLALPLPLFSEFSYLVPPSLEDKIQVGSLVEVEFKNRHLLGWVVALEDKSPPGLEIKEILRLAPVVPLDARKLLWAKTLSQLYLIPRGMMLSFFTPALLSSFWEAAGKRIFPGTYAEATPESFSVPPQGMNFFVFQEKFGRKKKKWEKLIKNGVLRREEEIFEVRESIHPEKDSGWWSIVTRGEREKFLLSFIEKVQKENRKALFVFPDFRALDYFTSFIESQFPQLRVMRYDSRLASRRRFLAYKLAEEGDFDLILGTRGSVFLPARDLYYHVIFDPEDKGHYSDRPPFHDTFRLLHEKVKIEGGSLEVVGITPSLSMYHFLSTKEFRKRDFPVFPRISPPPVNLVSYEKKWDSSLTFSVRKAILQVVSKKGTVLVWVQKRGYTPALGCRDCGFYYICPHCGVAFRYYKETQTLICPLCGKKGKIDLFCPRCGGVWLEGWGEGVEKVGEEMKKVFSHQQVAVIDSEKEEEMGESLSFSILVGTSLLLREEILQKASLLVIWSLEDWLYLPDMNAREEFYLNMQRIRTFLGLNSPFPPRIFIQGRKGMEKEIGQFLQPPHDFYPPLLEKRKILGYPPYGVLAHVIKRYRNREKDGLVLKKLRGCLEEKGIEAGGPFPAQGRKWGEESEEITIHYSREKAGEVFDVVSQFFSQEGKRKGEWQVEVEF
ncbi:MAG TPA: hypothetical protein PK016_03810 [Candidatus Atribacteria bacterium]|nr:hypothetical protein [Candidatus Atribacteria bacterium]